jgi:hypothetical protein
MLEPRRCFGDNLDKTEETGMPKNLQMLIDAARSRPVSADELQAQRRSFAYGNTKIENDRVTREMVAEQDELLLVEAKVR